MLSRAPSPIGRPSSVSARFTIKAETRESPYQRPDEACIVVLRLDDNGPLQGNEMMHALRWLEAFFQIPVRVVKVPEKDSLPSGWQSLAQRIHAHIRSRPGRESPDTENPLRQICVPDLMHCLGRALNDPEPVPDIDLDGALCIVGFTGSEFYHSGDGLVPDTPAPPERCQSLLVSSPKKRAAAVSFSRLSRIGAAQSIERHHPDVRKRLRQVLAVMTRAILETLGLLQNQTQDCLGYMRPFDCDNEHPKLHLCHHSEEALLRLIGDPPAAETRLFPPKRGSRSDRVIQPGTLEPLDVDRYIRKETRASRDALVAMAARRYRDLGDILADLGVKLGPIACGHRRYTVFEEECDWLHVAEEILMEAAGERKRNLSTAGEATAGERQRQRSLLTCLEQAHMAQPGRGILKRTFSAPFLPRTCLMDMAQAPPHQHERGDLSNWAMAVYNHQHSTGGHYVELGGSLKPKTVATFVDAGLNASMHRPLTTIGPPVAAAAESTERIETAMTGPITADALAFSEDDGISLQITLHNLDYGKLSTDRELLAAFQAAVKSALVKEIAHGVKPENVTLKLSAGSVCVQAKITLPEGVQANKILQKMRATGGLQWSARASKLSSMQRPALRTVVLKDLPPVRKRAA